MLSGVNQQTPAFVRFRTRPGNCSGNQSAMEVERVDRRVRRTRRLLREALLSLTLEKGYDQVTVQEVLDRADVGRATFYAHFTDKDDLLISGLLELRDSLREQLATMVRSDGSTRPEHPDLTRVLFEHAA